ncbi:MAG: ubiquinol-cytochrome c reductase iron-sulfur subunit [Gammaproteobacteria bacterium]|nr:ubiquinol-cytochrome c reductase iron-sulfur subunit [Gammaproteobacteria bacterium]
MSSGSFDTSGVDKERRLFVIAGTSAVGAVGALGATVAGIQYMLPSEKAKSLGAPVEVDISQLEAGMKMTVKWQGKPVWIVRRTDSMLQTLGSLTDNLADPASENTDQQPEYARNEHRSLKAEYLVMVGICTHLGCSPMYKPEPGAAGLPADWKGGFFCPCHGSRFDLAGRVFKGVPAPDNMPVPPHHYINDNIILVGEDA